MSRTLQRLIFGAAFLGLLAVPTTSALAHALLVRSNPPANARLDSSPGFVELVFSESLEPAFSSAEVLDVSGARVDNRDSNVDPADPTRMTLTLRPIGDGVYTVSWKAASSVDGHVTAGAFSFVIGNGSAPPPSSAGQASASASPSAAEVAAKWLGYLAAASIVGGTLFLLAVWEPGLRQVAAKGDAPLSPPWRALGQAGVVLLLLSSVASLCLQASAAAGTGLTPFRGPIFGEVVFATRYGTLWFVRLIVVLGLALLSWRGEGRAALFGRFVLGSLVLLSFSLGAHAATEARPALPLAADWLHLMAASAWVGGLGYFLAGLLTIRSWPAERRTHLTAELIPHFSVVAASSVAVIALSGVYSSLLRVGSWNGLWSTDYGRVLIAKILLALAMMGIGAINLLWVTPRMRRAAALPGGDPSLGRRFRRLVVGELTLGSLALLAAALLTSLAPAQVATVASGFSGTVRAGDLRIAVQIDPARPGINTFTVIITSAGQPVADAKEVALQFTPESAAVAPLRATLTGAGDGRYTTQGAFLTLPDKWQVQVSVRRQGMFDSIADVSVDLRPGGLAREMPWARLTGALLLAASVLTGATMWVAGGGRRELGGLALLAALTLAAAGATVLSRPLPTRNLVNPVQPNEASIASGHALYLENCVACHGAGGKGDGPIGLTLNPRPADLTLHTIPGVHPDGQLFAWITDGYPGSVMPAWKSRLSDTLRWNLVNYLRTLAPTPTP
jgi:copper transport protein